MPISAPTDIANLALWLDFSDAATLFSDNGVTAAVDGGPIQQINDKSGNARHYRQATAASRPTRVDANVNGIRAGRFDATDDGMACVAAFSLATPYTVAVVYRPRTNTGTHRVLQSSTANWLIGPHTGYNGHFAGNWVSQYSGIQTPPPTGTPFAVRGVATNTGAASKYYLSNVDHTTNGAFVTAPAALVLGAPGAFVEPADSDVGEVCAWTRVLTGAELTDLNAYLARWVYAQGVMALSASVAGVAYLPAYRTTGKPSVARHVCAPEGVEVGQAYPRRVA